MTSEIEKQFFDTFGIEPKFDRMRCDNDYECNGKCNSCLYQKDDNKHKFYPQITDRHYLELICIQNKFSHPYSFYGESMEFLKQDILRLLIEIDEFFKENDLPEYENFKHQVQSLFKENKK